MNETVITVGAVFAILIPIIGFIYWHFQTIHSFNEQVRELKLQMKELEHKDNLQQQTIDQLKDLFPVLKAAVEHLQNQKQLKK